MASSRRFRYRLLALLLVPVSAAALDLTEATAGFSAGPPPVKSMSSLAFGPEGLLFVGDGKSGALLAIDTEDREPGKVEERIAISDVETKIAAMLGTRASEVLIHDLAVNPISRNIYLSVSRGRGKWDSRWLLPNDLSDASILLRVTPTGDLDAVDLEDLKWSRASLPDPIDVSKQHRWKKGVSLRSDTITDVAWDDGTVWVTGLSNEEFASTLWRLPFPFGDDSKATKTTVEIFHGAHGKWETHAPIRTFVPYELGGKDLLLAAYLCTPLATFETDSMADGQHVKGRTVAEFGSGNYPLDMFVYKKGGKDRILISNSNLPLMIVDPEDIASYQGAITEEVSGYTEGVPYETRSGSGYQQMDRLGDDRFVALQRLPGGTLDLVSGRLARF